MTRLLILLALLAAPAFAERPPTVQVDRPDPVQLLPPSEDFGNFLLTDGPQVFPQQVGTPTRLAGPATVPDPSDATLAAYDMAVRAQYAASVRSLDHRTAVFAWQHLSSQIIFFVVIGIVGIGLYFSWMQFHATRPGDPAVITQLELSGTGLKVSSPVLGVIILVLSLAFFYLYLTHVYPISELG